METCMTYHHAVFLFITILLVRDCPCIITIIITIRVVINITAGATASSLRPFLWTRVAPVISRPR